MRPSFTFLFHHSSTSNNLNRKNSNVAALERTTLVLRNLPGPWGSRNKSLVQEFVSRVFLAQPALVMLANKTNNNQSKYTMSNIMDRLRQPENQNQSSSSPASEEEAKSPISKTTIPAGHIPPHIREKWGLSSLDSSATKTNDFSQGLAKYFNKNKNQNQFHQQQTRDTILANSNGNAAHNQNLITFPRGPEFAAQLVRVKFTGETRRTMSVAIQFRDAKAANAFATLLPMYLTEVRRSRGLSIPSALVGEIADSRKLGYHHGVSLQQQLQQQRNENKNDAAGDDENGKNESDEPSAAAPEYDGTVTAATLDFLTSNCGMYCTVPAREELPELLKVPERREDHQLLNLMNRDDDAKSSKNNEKQTSSSPTDAAHKKIESLKQSADVIRRDKERRKELALALFRSAGKSATATQTNTQLQQHQQQHEPQPDQVRMNVFQDLRFRQHDVENLYESRTEELNELMETNPLLSFGDEGNITENTPPPTTTTTTTGTSLFIDPTSITTATEAASKKKTTFISPRLFGPSMQALTFYESRKINNNADAAPNPNLWQDSASEEELAACSRISLDRFMMSPDVLWDIRKKYMPRRIWSSGEASSLDTSSPSAGARSNNDDGNDNDENDDEGDNEKEEENDDVVEGGQFVFANRGRMRRITRKEVDQQRQDHDERWGLTSSSKSKKRRMMNQQDDGSSPSKSENNWWTTDVFG